MAYDLIGFTNDNPPAINAANLNKMDNGIKNADTGLTALKNAVESNLYVQGNAQQIASTNYSTLLPNLNNAEVNRIYAINGCLQSISNIPAGETGSSATLFTFAYNTTANKNWYVQFLIPSSMSKSPFYFRSCWFSTWGAWQKVADDSDVVAIQESITSSSYVQNYSRQITSSNYSTYLSDLNNAEVNRIYAINGCLQSIANIPAGETAASSATLFTFAHNTAANKNWYVQLLIPSSMSKSPLYFRSRWFSTWGAWQKVADDSDVVAIQNAITSSSYLQGYSRQITSSNYSTYLSDLNDAELNRIYSINGCLQSIAHKPADTTESAGTLFTFAYNTTANKSWYVQFLITNGTDRPFFYRVCWGGNWADWKKLITDFDISTITNAISYIMKADSLLRRYYVNTCVDKTKTNINSGSKIIAYGDSITHGSQQNGSWVAELSNIIGCTNVNKAVTGAVFAHSLEEKPENYWISTQIDGTTNEEWSDADLVFVAAGTNDAGYGTTNAELAQYVQDAITKIKGKTNAHIVFITPIRRYADDNAINMKLPLVSGIIENIALANDCSVICGFDIPLPTHTIETYIENFTVDGLHPNLTGNKVYARSIIGEIL